MTAAPSSDPLFQLATRAGLGRAITRAESTRPDHQAEARTLLSAIMPHTGQAQRIGITGVPGVGKSTFIDAFGSMLTEQGHKVAVLAVDPTSRRSRGSILGDKTRMAKLSVDPNAFIRPSPAGDMLGGVGRKTRETMLLCEAGGYDVVLVETVGVGQSETVVSDMVDFFLVLMLPNAGDDLQGIKKGVLEAADLIAVNKADIDEQAARRAARHYETALHILGGRPSRTGRPRSSSSPARPARVSRSFGPPSAGTANRPRFPVGGAGGAPNSRCAGSKPLLLKDYPRGLAPIRRSPTGCGGPATKSPEACYLPRWRQRTCWRCFSGTPSAL